MTLAGPKPGLRFVSAVAEQQERGATTVALFVEMKTRMYGPRELAVETARHKQFERVLSRPEGSICPDIRNLPETVRARFVVRSGVDRDGTAKPSTRSIQCRLSCS